MEFGRWKWSVHAFPKGENYFTNVIKCEGCQFFVIRWEEGWFSMVISMLVSLLLDLLRENGIQFWFVRSISTRNRTRCGTMFLRLPFFRPPDTSSNETLSPHDKFRPGKLCPEFFRPKSFSEESFTWNLRILHRKNPRLRRSHLHIAHYVILNKIKNLSKVYKNLIIVFIFFVILDHLFITLLIARVLFLRNRVFYFCVTT